MAQQQTLVVHGYREFLAAAKGAGPAASRAVRGAFREAGNVVKEDATRKFAAYDARSAAGYRVVVRTRGVSVEQSLRKTTGKHPEYGGLQMRSALIPALDENEGRVVDAFDAALDTVADYFEGSNQGG